MTIDKSTHIMINKLMSGPNTNTIFNYPKFQIISRCINYFLQLLAMLGEDKISSLLWTGILILLWDAFTLEEFSVIKKEIFLRSVIKSILSLNHFREEQSQGLGGICMPFLQPASQQMAQEEILPSVFIPRIKRKFKSINLGLFFQAHLS